MPRRSQFVCGLLILVCLSGFGQAVTASPPTPSLFSLTMTPKMSIPLGRDAPLYALGGGAELTAAYRIPALPLLFAEGSVGYLFVPLKAVTSFSLLSGGLGAGIHLDLGKRLWIRASGTGGYFYAFLNDGSGAGGANPFVSGGVDLSYMLLPGVSASVGGAYEYCFGLYNGLSVHLSASYGFPRRPERPAKPVVEKKPLPKKPAPLEKKTSGTEPQALSEPGVEITRLDFSGVFPVFFKSYSDNAVGRMVLYNRGKTAAENITVSFLVKQYMDNPKLCPAPQSLRPGEEKEIELFGLFKSTILEISEPTLVSANITVEYTLAGQAQRKEATREIRISDRNAMTWDDDRKAAAFVTAKDPTVLKFSKNVASMLKGSVGEGVNANLLSAIGIHEALRQYGLSYVVDPATPHKEISQNKQAVDFLQFPVQTLEYKAGDCDDLSILYCALLESVGVETAFITIPGHIFMAISLGAGPDEVRRTFQRPDDLIFIDGKAWVPIEVTERTGGFLKAWDMGAREWRENQARNQAGFYPTHASWDKYESVGFSGAVVPIDIPPQGAVVKAYAMEVTSFIDREISPRVAALQADMKKAQDPAKATNTLGVLYARYGLYERAEKEFMKLVGKEYVPALINMGNILLGRNDTRQALAYFRRAQKKEPGNPRVLLAVARASHELENYGEAKLAYAALKELDPNLASKFAYLDLRGEEAVRAAEIGQVKSVMIWEEGR